MNQNLACLFCPSSQLHKIPEEHRNRDVTDFVILRGEFTVLSEKYSMFFSVSTLFDCCIGMWWWYTCFWLFRGGTITTRSIIFRIPNDVKGFGSRHAFPPLQSVSWDSTNESQDIPCSFLQYQFMKHKPGCLPLPGSSVLNIDGFYKKQG